MRYPMVLKLDVSGLPDRWINWQDAACAYARGRVRWEAGDETFLLTGGMRGGLRSTLVVNTIIAVADRSRKFGLTPRLTNPALYARDGYVCLYCGERFPVSKLSRDHIHPLSKGGPDTWENVATACTLQRAQGLPHSGAGRHEAVGCALCAVNG